MPCSPDWPALSGSLPHSATAATLPDRCPPARSSWPCLLTTPAAASTPLLSWVASQLRFSFQLFPLGCLKPAPGIGTSPPNLTQALLIHSCVQPLSPPLLPRFLLCERKALVLCYVTSAVSSIVLEGYIHTLFCYRHLLRVSVFPSPTQGCQHLLLLKPETLV